MEQATRDNCKHFHEIADSVFLQPELSLQCKAIVSVKKKKMRFCREQLKQIVFMLMGELPYLLFLLKSETKRYNI